MFDLPFNLNAFDKCKKKNGRAEFASIVMFHRPGYWEWVPEGELSMVHHVDHISIEVDIP